MMQSEETQGCVDAMRFARLANKDWLGRSGSAGWGLGISCRAQIRPASVVFERCIVRQCSVYEVILSFPPSRVSTVRCRLLCDLLAPLFSWALWQRPALSFPLCILLTLAAVSLPRSDKTRLNHTHAHTHSCFVVHRSTTPAHFALSQEPFSLSACLLSLTPG